MRKVQPDFSSPLPWIPISHLLARVSLEERVLSGRGVTFSSSHSTFCTFVWSKPEECPFLRGTAATWPRRRGPELLDGSWGTIETILQRHLWEADAGLDGQLSVWGRSICWVRQGRAVILQNRNVAALMLILVARGIAADPTYPEESLLIPRSDARDQPSKLGVGS